MSDKCRLRHANGIVDGLCDESACIYWRVVDHVGLTENAATGCAVQYFELLDGDTAVAQWLLSVKERVERLRFDA